MSGLPQPAAAMIAAKVIVRFMADDSFQGILPMLRQ